MKTLTPMKDIDQVVSENPELIEFIELEKIRPVAQALAFGFKAGAGLPMSKRHIGDFDNDATTVDPLLFRELDNLELKNDEDDFECDDRFRFLDVNFIATLSAYILGSLFSGSRLIAFKPKRAVIEAFVGADGDLEDYDRDFIARGMTTLGMIFPWPNGDGAYTFAPIGLLALQTYAVATGVFPRTTLWIPLYDAIREFGTSFTEADASGMISTNNMNLRFLVGEATADDRTRTFVEFWNVRERLAAYDDVRAIMNNEPADNIEPHHITKI